MTSFRALTRLLALTTYLSAASLSSGHGLVLCVEIDGRLAVEASTAVGDCSGAFATPGPAPLPQAAIQGKHCLDCRDLPGPTRPDASLVSSRDTDSPAAPLLPARPAAWLPAAAVLLPAVDVGVRPWPTALPRTTVLRI